MKNFGMCFAGSASVCVWIDGETEIVEYNLSDKTGNHPWAELPENHPLREQLCDAKQKARDEALAEREYQLARRRDTSFSQLEYAFLVTVGRNDTYTVYIDEKPNSSATFGGYHITEKMLAEIDRLGIPLIDMRPIPLEKLATVVWEMPMFPVKPDRVDSPPYNSFSFAPIAFLAQRYAEAGAIVKNVRLTSG